MNSEISESAGADAMFFIFDTTPEGRVLVTASRATIPSAAEAEEFRDYLTACGPVSKCDGGDMWGAAGPILAQREDCVFVSRRELPGMFGHNLFKRSCTAYQMMNLTVKNKFCGACGAPMRDHAADRARFCPECGNTVYPVLAAAVIVAVEKDGMLLLGRNVNFPPDRYSVLAGFVEPGETLEEAARREVYEESRVVIKNVRYFGNQPWPFPNSMMFGFNADWESGEPTPDEHEITDVRWFEPTSLPNLPPPISISRKLINGWLERVAGHI
ncbi:MAG: NAD(+) diphosphatase [Synergistaceae bacterium]|jgi:NAD+ diphosphatase|nr:NAD(+) diphosphatase [Synergistaceae bacterium]